LSPGVGKTHFVFFFVVVSEEEKKFQLSSDVETLQFYWKKSDTVVCATTAT
jgi:hypothetical protein